jgi:hypothetical protein
VIGSQNRALYLKGVGTGGEGWKYAYRGRQHELARNTALVLQTTDRLRLDETHIVILRTLEHVLV